MKKFVGNLCDLKQFVSVMFISLFLLLTSYSMGYAIPVTTTVYGTVREDTASGLGGFEFGVQYELLNVTYDDQGTYTTMYTVTGEFDYFMDSSFFVYGDPPYDVMSDAVFELAPGIDSFFDVYGGNFSDGHDIFWGRTNHMSSYFHISVFEGAEGMLFSSVSNEGWVQIHGPGYAGTSGFGLFSAKNAAGQTENLVFDNIEFETQIATVAPVPEPATMLLFGLGLLGLAGINRKKL